MAVFSITLIQYNWIFTVPSFSDSSFIHSAVFMEALMYARHYSKTGDTVTLGRPRNQMQTLRVSLRALPWTPRVAVSLASTEEGPHSKHTRAGPDP